MYGARKVWRQLHREGSRGGSLHGGASHAPRRPKRRGQRRNQAHDHPRRGRGPTRRSGRPQLRSGPPGPSLARRHHLCSDLVGLRVCGVGDRRLFPVRRRLASVELVCEPTWLSTPSNKHSGHGDPTQPPPTGGWSITPTPAVNICPFVTRTGSPKPASNPRSARLAIRTITPSPNPSSACTRQNSSTNALPGRTSTTSSTPPSNTWTGSTTEGFSNPSETSHQQKRRPTTIKSTPQHH